jgi:phosphatidylglycerol lysyltransferase
MGTVKIAEEAVIDLPAFSLAGGKRAALRSLVHKVTRAGLCRRPYARGAAPTPPSTSSSRRSRKNGWRRSGSGRWASRWAGSRWTRSRAPGVSLSLPQRVEAFCSWLEYRGGRAVVLDLMRKRRDAVSGTMDLLLPSRSWT